MQRFLLPALLSITALSGGSALSQQCLNGWCRGGCMNNRCHFLKVLSRNYPRIIVNVNTPDIDNILKTEIDCQQYKTRMLFSDGTRSEWFLVMPGTVGQENIEVACRM